MRPMLGRRLGSKLRATVICTTELANLARAMKRVSAYSLSPSASCSCFTGSFSSCLRVRTLEWT